MGSSLQSLRIGFVSTRFHGTDGVTLEAKKWARELERRGHEAYWFAGKLDTPEERSFLCERAFFDDPVIAALQEKLFGCEELAEETAREMRELIQLLKKALGEFIEKFELDVLVPQNALAIPMNVPLGVALAEVYEERGIAVVAHHHDFSWERTRFSPTAVPDLLAKAFPPAATEKFRHAVINSNAQRELERRRGVPSVLVPNVFDFENPPPTPDGYGADFREEFGIGEEETLILQPTRIVPRKGIEHAIELCRQLQERGRRVCLVISHLGGDEGFAYENSLKEMAVVAGVRLLLLGERIGEERGKNEQGEKLYTLWDAYPHADFVTYPSLYEGFGNAFLEAVYFRKPLLVNRYSVYEEDLRPHGFDVVEMDGEVTAEVVEAVEAVLQAPEERRVQAANHNYALCLREYSHAALEEKLGLLFAGLG